jgi:hypothetical protein
MGSLLIRMQDNSGAGVVMLELAARNAGDWSPFWGDKNSPLSMAWARSRREMFLSQGSSTGATWPAYTSLERKYWAPVKRAVLGVKTLDKGSILRWSPSPSNSGAAAYERLYPSMGYPSHPEYVYTVTDNSVEMGTRVPYARNHDKGLGAYQRRFKTKTVTIPTPRRPLVRFGEPFIEDVRRALGQVVGAMDGQVGITDQELADRYKLNGGRIGL